MNECTPVDPLLEKIERFIDGAGMSATAFGKKAVGDPGLVHDLRRGRECKRALRARVETFIAHHTQQAAPERKAA